MHHNGERTMSTPSVDLNDVRELSLDELDAVTGGALSAFRDALIGYLVEQGMPVATKAIGQDVLAFAASQGVR
jgi:hypothetical protein